MRIIEDRISRFRAIGRSFALGLCLASAACGGGSSSEAPPSPPVTLPPTNPAPPPAPAPTPTPPVADFQPVIQAVENFGETDFSIIVGDATGILLEYEKGNFPVTGQYQIASATKWYTAATIMTLVDTGTMQLSDNPQNYLPYWTSDPADERSAITLEQLLSFTSGFNAAPLVNSCVTEAQTTVQDCAEEIYGFDIASEPGTAYAYGPHHMQIAAAMAERASGVTFTELFRQNIADPLSMSAASSYANPSQTNPRASGGALSTGRDYALFLQSLLAGSLLNDPDAFTGDRTTNVTFLFRPEGTEENGDWHYALGAWLECDEQLFSQSCADARIYSSPGAFGWTPWIDFRNGYFAIIARRGSFGSASASLELERILQPLIVNALKP